MMGASDGEPCSAMSSSTEARTSTLAHWSAAYLRTDSGGPGVPWEVARDARLADGQASVA